MAIFCIPKQLAKELKKAAKNGEINIAQLYDMTSEQRREFFQEYTDLPTATEINAGFERAIVSEQKKALANWAEEVFVGKQKKHKKGIVDKINNLSESDLLDVGVSGAFMEDLVTEALGAKVSPEEAKKIDEFAEVLRKEEAKGLNELGTYKIGFWEAKRELENYLSSLTPSSNVKITTSTIRRGLMLTSPKSALVNIVGNTTIGFEQSLERRIKSGVVRGVVNQKLLKDYRSYAMEVYNKAGFDITRMQDIGEGKKTLGEKITHSQGDGVVRKFGRVMEDIVFTKMLGAPDVWFSAWAMADSANLQATRQAKDEGLKGKALENRATQLFKDAISISSSSDPGNRIRTQSIADAEFATYTNKGSLATASLKSREMLNAFQEDLAIGDQVIPFAKTPANAIQFSFDSGGVSFLRGISKMPSAIKEFKLGNPAGLRDAYADMFRSGFGIIGAILLVQLFDPEDFIGMYPTSQKEKELLKIKGATPNSIKIGNRYISLDYFGGFRGSLVGMMNAKKYSGNFVESAYNFARGNVAQLSDLPGIEQAADAAQFINDVAPSGRLDQDELVKRSVTLTSDYSRSLIMPSIMSDIAKAFDESERAIDWNKPADRWIASIPGLRSTLPEKLDVFGEVLKGEPAYSVLLFGARVRTARDSKIVDEIRRLDETGNLPSITRPQVTSTRVKAYKNQVSEEKYNEMLNNFRSNYKKIVSRVIDTGKYKRLTDEKKAKVFNDIKSKSLDVALKKGGYRRPKK